MDKLLKDTLKEQIQLKGLSFESLRERTGIAERYLTGLLENDKEKLPAAPYVRGYLMKLATALDLNGQELWETYKHELLEKTSGPKDRLPVNRYALKRINKAWLLSGVILLLAVIYLTVNSNRFIGSPNIEIVNPDFSTIVTTANSIELLGKIKPADKLLIDGEEVITDAEGNFQKIHPLTPGLNIIEFTVKRILGKETKVLRQVIYEPQEPPEEETSESNLETL